MSPLRELRAAHGGSSSRQAINRAIRAEIPAGALVLDRLQDWHRICDRLGWGHPGEDEPLQVTAYRHLLEIADEMEDEIRRRYGMPPRPLREDLRR
jgi:hypothetical protein